VCFCGLLFAGQDAELFTYLAASSVLSDNGGLVGPDLDSSAFLLLKIDISCQQIVFGVGPLHLILKKIYFYHINYIG
jgi:hypothetical protein